MGYDTLFFGRMTDSERLSRIINHTMDFMWQPTFETVDGPVNASRGLFTHLMYNTYNAPCGIPLTNFWNPDEAWNLRTQFMYNLTSNSTFADNFVTCWREMGEAYGTKNVLVSWGQDFAYFDSENTYGLIDDIMSYLKDRGFNLIYSTVGNFANALQEENKDLQIFTGDFFPMEEAYKDSFWTGYYTSRPNSKRRIREFSAFT